ncbi:MAG TPA: M23 family metallopeptidase [Burkholderiaceae bacterium]|jgi:murein DD-endopeptidase MepM/ murein hydrolase activator NlpD|nr:M23 family metallopeptidase [Burkholderiaceae bacterium]
MPPVAWPLTSNKIRRGLINHTFGMVRDGGKRAHQGWDFEAVPGTPVFAISDGTVHLITESAGGDYGMQISLAFEFNGMTLYAQYCHLSKCIVGNNTKVTRNTIIGHTGNTGNAKSMKGADQHLHFEIRLVPRPGRGLGNRLNPIDVYQQHPPLAVPVLDLHDASQSIAE